MTCTEPQVKMLGISQLGLGTAKKSLSFFGMLRRVERLCRTTIELSCFNLGIHKGLSNARWQALAGGRFPRADFNLRQTILDQFGAAGVPLGGGTYALGSLRCVPPSSDELVCVTSAICRIPRQFANSLAITFEMSLLSCHRMDAERCGLFYPCLGVLTLPQMPSRSEPADVVGASMAFRGSIASVPQPVAPTCPST